MTGPTVAELSEEELLAVLTPLLPDSSASVVGNGDDCAVLAAGDGRYAVSTDVLVEGRHFRRDWMTGWDVGERAAAQNLADVAAMGARAVALVVSLVLPGPTPVRWVQDLARGLAVRCEAAGAGVVGGDLSGGEQIIVAVTVLGDLEGRAPVRRSGAQPGDVVVLAGRQGCSAAGLALLSAGRGDDDGDRAAAECVERYRTPHPPLDLGPALAEAGATAMMDVSDSLLRDGGRLARASGVRIDLDDPLDPRATTALAQAARALTPVARRLEPTDAAAAALAGRWVLTGGEDHGMLATVPPHVAGALPGGVRPIGRVLATEGQACPCVTVAGRAWREGIGWDHFSA